MSNYEMTEKNKPKKKDDDPCWLIKHMPQAIWLEKPNIKKPRRSNLNKSSIEWWNLKKNQ